MRHFLSSSTNAPPYHPEVVDEHVGCKFHDGFAEKFQTRLAPHDQLGREGPTNHMEDHHALD
jgi:hypothetical protein